MKKWYAVMMDREDNDWGTGSFDPAEAFDMLRNERMVNNHWESYIAVVENDVCVEEIEPSTDTVDQSINDIDGLAAMLVRCGWEASDRDELAIKYELGTEMTAALIAAIEKAARA